jgi:hypothetical protein
MGDQSLNSDATTYCGDQCLFNFDTIEAKDQDADTLFSFSKSVEDGFYTVVRLKKQLHAVSPGMLQQILSTGDAIWAREDVLVRGGQPSDRLDASKSEA